MRGRDEAHRGADGRRLATSFLVELFVYPGHLPALEAAHGNASPGSRRSCQARAATGGGTLLVDGRRLKLKSSLRATSRSRAWTSRGSRRTRVRRTTNGSDRHEIE